MRKTMKEYPREMQPRERAWKSGVGALTNAELLAIVLRTGTPACTALELAHRILAREKSLNRIHEMSLGELGRYPGMGRVKALCLQASLQLGRRMLAEQTPEYPVIKSPGDAADIVMEEMRHLKKENFRMIALNTKNHVLAVETISVGNLNSSIVHPRELFREAIRHSAAGIILVHNHPSGDTDPSPEDIQITQRIVDAGRIMGIEVLDHLIVGGNGYLSFREQDIL